MIEEIDGHKQSDIKDEVKMVVLTLFEGSMTVFDIFTFVSI